MHTKRLSTFSTPTRLSNMNPARIGVRNGLAALVIAMVAAMPMHGCHKNPATGEYVLNLLPTAQAVRIGKQAAPKYIQKFGGLVEDPTIRRYVSKLGQRLAAVSEKPGLPWEFYVVDSAVVNAFALPGGKIFVTRGLLSKLENEAQLAGVLGHEIAHVVAEHVGQQMTKSLIAKLGRKLVLQATEEQWVALLAGVGSKLTLLHFSRAQEAEADRLALRYMTQLNYNPAALVGVMRLFKRISQGSGGLFFLQSHPVPQERIENLQRLIVKKFAYTQNTSRFDLEPRAYQKNVLSDLARLPPPDHRPRAAG